MPPKRKSTVKATLNRVENGLRRLFRSKDHALPATKPKILHLNFTDWDGLERFNGIRRTNSGVFEPLNLAIDRFSQCVKMFEEQARTREGYNKLGADLNDLFHALTRHIEETDPTSRTLDTFRNLARSIDDETAPFESDQDKELQDDEGATRDVEKVLKCYRRVRTLLALFLMNESTKMWEVGDDENRCLGRFSHSPNAHYRAADSKAMHRTGCMLNTRVDVLQDLRDWVHYGKFQKVYWLSGIAGTGKTTVAYSLCEWLENSGKPSASFFCSRHLPDCRDANRVLPSVSYQLARLSRPFRCAVSSIVDQDFELCHRAADEQFDRLIAAPLQMVGHTFGVDVVVVLDALDECEDKDGVDQILDACFKHSSDLPVKFVITSRQNPGILERMLASQPGPRRTELRLHEVDRTVAREDIKTCLRAKLGGLNLSDDDVESLALRSGGWFLYAVSVANFVNQDDAPGKPEHLKRLLNIASYTGNTFNQEMDPFFATILGEATKQTDLDGLRQTEVMLVLRTLLCAQDPVPINAIAGLLRLNFDCLVHTVLRRLLPVLHMSKGSEMGLALCDSFASYLSDPQRSGNYHCDIQQGNELLAQSCFAVFDTANPAFNVCNLKSSYLLDREVAGIDTRANELIPQAIWYASQHWATHLKLAGLSDGLSGSLHCFLSKRLLLWMEVMNLKHCISRAVRLLHGVHTWLQEVECPTSIQDLTFDAWEFVAAFSSSAVSQSTPHIYVSALPFWPAHRPVSVHYMPMLGCAVKARRPRLKMRGGDLHVGTKTPVHQPLESHTDWVMSVAYSPNGAHIASGSADGTIRIWDGGNGIPVGRPLRGHTDWVTSVAYSLDGAYIWSGADDHTVRIWDAQTGKAVGRPLKGRTRWVTPFAYSPDGAYFTSRSSDDTVRIWDTQTGRPVGQPLKGHTGRVYSVAYSPDGAYIASGADDNTIQIWDARNGNPVGRPLKGHTDCVMSVAYSLDGAYITSGSQDKTVRIWEAQTGQPVGQSLKGHTDYVNSVVYSPDGAYIASSSDDMTVRTWDARTGQPVGQPLEGHTGNVMAVAYSPDGAYIVSGSEDKTIRIWDSRAGLRTQLANDPSPSIHPAAHSPDHSLLPSTFARYIARSLRKPALANKSSHLLTPEQLPRCWVIDDQGWAVNDRQERLIWVPEDLREFLLVRPELVRIPLGDRIMLDFRDAKLGTEWRDCFDPSQVYA